jgi:hypothetical protein
MIRAALMLALLALAPIAACTPTAPAPAEEARDVVAEAAAFMEEYADDLLRGDREAIIARYDPRGAYFAGNGFSELVTHEALAQRYREQWEAPAAFEWVDLKYEPLGDDAIMVLGKFHWTAAEGEAPIVLSYTGLLVRSEGEWRIRVEDESTSPPA